MDRSHWTRPKWLAAAAATLFCGQAMADAPRAVVELFTSQGCSSCPPAEAVAGRLRTEPDVLVLSFHVNYWDDLGWRDTFSSQASTQRQYEYARSLKERSVFTPQVIVNGVYSLVGSQEAAIRRLVFAQSGPAFPVKVELSTQPNNSLSLNLAGSAPGADVWEIRYVRHAATPVRAGENNGRVLETFNNVTRIRHLGKFVPGVTQLAPLTAPEDGIAVLVQASGMGALIGAATH
jgi:hypothetical protein